MWGPRFVDRAHLRTSCVQVCLWAINALFTWSLRGCRCGHLTSTGTQDEPSVAGPSGTRPVAPSCVFRACLDCLRAAQMPGPVLCSVLCTWSCACTAIHSQFADAGSAKMPHVAPRSLPQRLLVCRCCAPVDELAPRTRARHGRGAARGGLRRHSYHDGSLSAGRARARGGRAGVACAYDGVRGPCAAVRPMHTCTIASVSMTGSAEVR